MQRPHTRYCLLAVIVSGLAGCLPATYTAVPKLTGRVLDTTGSPVPGATVAVHVDCSDPGDQSWLLNTDTRGVFARPEETHWSLAPVLPVDFLSKTYVAVASAGVRRSQPKAFNGGITNYHFLGLTNPTVPADFGDLVIVETPGHR